MVDDATHATKDALAQRGIQLTPDQMDSLNDWLAAFCRDLPTVKITPV